MGPGLCAKGLGSGGWLDRGISYQISQECATGREDKGETPRGGAEARW
jgi:hypothetical protein